MNDHKLMVNTINKPHSQVKKEKGIHLTEASTKFFCMYSELRNDFQVYGIKLFHGSDCKRFLYFKASN